MMTAAISRTTTTIDPGVLLLGAAGLDLVGVLQGPLQPGSSTPAQIRSSHGGVARNVAENLARLGRPAHLISAVGADRSGEELLEATAAAGVDTSAVLRSPDFPTGSYLAVIDAHGRLQFALDDMRVLQAVTPQHLQQHEALFRGARLAFVDANLPPATLRTAVSLCHKARIPLCADPTSSSLAERLLPHLDHLHLITPNSTEAGILTGQPFESSDRSAALEAARALVNRGVKIALITLAEFGVAYASSETTGHIPAIRTELVDPTGAGDALSAAVILGLLDEMPLDEAVRLGVSAASLTLRSPGSVCQDLSLEKLYDQLLI